jgi:hypothetical protein
MSRHELVPCAFLALPAMTRSHVTLGWNVIASEVGGVSIGRDRGSTDLYTSALLF